MSQSSCTTKRALGSVLSWVLWGVLSLAAYGQSSVRPIESGAPTVRVEMGLGKVWKVGYATRMLVRVDASSPYRCQVQIRTMDGDGVPVVYSDPSWKVEIADSGSQSFEAFVQHGRARQPILVQLVDERGSVQFEHAVRLEERGEVLPATQPWLVAIGARLGIEQGALKSVDGALPNVTTSVLSDGSELPSSSQGYSGVDQIVLSTVDAEQLRKLNDRQIAALRRWVEQGGRLFVSMGVHAKTIAETEWLQAMLPAKVRDLQEGIDPGSLESWVNSEKPLPKLICTRLEPCSLVDLSATTIRREPFPLIARHALGLGQVTCLATDLDSSDMLAWPDRNKLLDKLLLGAWKRKGRDAREKDAGSSIGYDDLAGQLRATLDYFPGVQSGSIPLMATLLVAFLLVVGPLDYFIVARHWKRPSWTWGTLLMATAVSSLVIGSLAIQWKPKQLQLNQMVVWDLDWSSKTIRGRAWFHLYSGNQERYDVEANTRPVGTVAPSSLPVGIDWLGLPGNGLGGFDSAVASDRGMPEYRMIRDASKAESMRSIRQLGIPQAGTKTMQGSWSTPWENAPELQPLSIIPGSDMLQGKWKNTLGVDILDGAILFRNWLYALPTRFQPDQEVELSITSQPKDLVRRLQRRRIIDGAERSIPWNPIDRNELERLGEVMLFYKSAGGEGYTSLKHRYIQQIDLSDSLRLDRAIVIGQIKENTLQLSARAEGEERAIADAIHETWIRILIPVAGQQ